MMKIKYIALVLFLFCGNSFAKPLLEDFLKERDLRNVVISPDGKYLARLHNKDGLRIVTINDFQSPDKPVLGTLSDKYIRAHSISWAKPDRLLVNVLVPYDTKKIQHDAENKKDFNIDDYAVYSRTLAMDVNGKNVVVLMNNEKSLRGNVNLSTVHHYLPKDPRHILMEAYRDGVDTLYKVDVYTGESELLAKGSRFTFMFINDYEGNTRYRFDYMPIAKKMIIYEFLADKKWGLIDTIEPEKVDRDDFDPGELIGLYGENLAYIKKNETSGFNELLVYKSKEKVYETLVSLPDRDVLYALSDLRSNQIIGYAVDNGYFRYKYFDSTYQAAYDKLAEQVGNANFYISSITENGNLSIVNLASPEDPSSFNLYDAQKNELSLIGHAYNGIATQNLSTSAVANYATRDGKKIHAYLLLPADYQPGKTYPLIVMPHGGPQSRDYAIYDDFAQFLSTRGYIVMKPNYRGSTGVGREFESAGYKQWGQLMQDDLTDGVHFMVKKGYADPSRVCVVGISYGGYAALMGAVKTPDVFRCSVSINGVTHLRDLIKYDEKQLNEDDFIQKYLYQRIGDPEVDKAMLDANSPALQADKIKTPLLVIASTNDERVPYSQAKSLISALKKNDKDYKFVELKDAYHNPFLYKKDIKTVYSEVESFLAKYLTAPEAVK